MEVGNATTAVNSSLGFDYTALIVLGIGIIIAASVLVGLAIYLTPYLIAWYKFREREKNSLEYVLMQIKVPKGNEVKIDAAEQLFGALYAIKKSFKGPHFLHVQPHISFEIVALPESIRFYVACHKSHKDLIEKQINGAYPDAEILEVPEYNIFSENGQTAYAMYKLRAANHFPIKTYRDMPTDPMSALTSALARMSEGEGAVIQMMIAPADGKWKDKGKEFVKKEKDPGTGEKPKAPPDQKQLEAVENKLSKNGFEFTIRAVVSSTDKDSAKTHLFNIKSAFEQFNGPYNGFSGAKVVSEKGFMTDFVYRYLPKFSKLSVLTADEIASVFHFPNKSVETPHLEWLMSKKAPAPDKIPTSGLYIGKSIFRGSTRAVYLADRDRERHMYIIGRTGGGKSQLLQTMMLQDVLAGKGLCFIDPHGDAAEAMLQLIPPNRAQDVIYFDPSDTERPMGLNMLEAYSEDQKHIVVASVIGLMYKLFDPQQVGIIGPRFEHGVRNAMLTAMSRPGATFMEVVRLMTDSKFVQELLPSVQDPVVRRYWTDQIAQTSDFHKSEVLDYTVSKFGRFVTNTMMRNIIGQSKSSFDLRDVMDNKKILIVNLSKGRMGEENSNFLGLVLVPRILAAAMSRANMPEEERVPFYLYVDEFQNFATDTFAEILSEARKYRLNLIVANQFIGQMQENIKNAIFGNVGTLAAFRVGITDASYLQNEFAPTFNEQDLVNIEAYHIYMKTQVNGEPVAPFSISLYKDMKAWEALKRPDIGRAIVELSRLTYGRDRATVEAEIAHRAQL